MENRSSRMRFFLEFVSCCASPTRHTLESSSSSPAEDQERWLVPAQSVNTTTTSSTSVSSRNRLRKKQWKGNASDWKPSLGPISEDIVAAPKGSRVVSKEVMKKKTAARGGAASKVYHRSYSDGYYDRSSSIAMIMPGFSPTPFMF